GGTRRQGPRRAGALGQGDSGGRHRAAVTGRRQAAATAVKCPAVLRAGGPTMDRASFEAEVQREGYVLREGHIEPNTHRPAHSHPFDARLFVLEGGITLVFGTERVAYGPGDTCSVPAGTMHEEHTEASGVRYLAGRRTK